MQMSEKIDKLAEALAQAQAEIEDAEKSRQNPAYRSQYSTLGDVWDACRAALTKNGLSVTQGAEPSEHGMVSLTTTLLHKSGQFLSHTQTFRLAKDDPQGYGSGTTYARRYGLAAMVGVCPDDDDGNAASGRAAQQRAPAPTPAPAVSRAVEEAVREKVAAADPRAPLWDELKALAKQHGVKPQSFIDAVFPNDGHGGIRAADLSYTETQKVLESARTYLLPQEPVAVGGAA